MIPLRHLLAAVLCLLPLHAEPATTPSPQTATSPASAHPFLNTEGTPRWSMMTLDQARKDFEVAKKRFNEQVQTLKNVTEPTYENTFGILETVDEDLERLNLRLEVLDSMCNTAEQRTAVSSIISDTSALVENIMIDGNIQQTLQKAAACDWAKTLPPERNRYMTQIMKQFRENGGNLPPEGKKRLSEINRELLTLSSQFSSNLLDSNNQWEFLITDPKKLAGISYSMRRFLQTKAEEQGHSNEENPQWLATASDGSAGFLLSHADDASLREAIWRGLNTIGRGKYDNGPVIERILALRDEEARLLGFPNYADMVARDRMIGSAENAARFLQTIHDAIKPAYMKEMNAFLRLKKEQTGDPAARLAPWDIPYYGSKIFESEHKADRSKLDSYLRADKVLDGMFSIFSELYGISITERPTVAVTPGSGKPAPAGSIEVWAPNVRYYEIRDKATDNRLGAFYLDLDPRPDKREGTWMQGIESGAAEKNGRPRILPVAAICSHIDIGTADEAATIDPEDIQALFHEFGHTLHHCLSDVGIRDLSGTNTVLDFVEFPSQICENWVWERESLNRFARQRTTGKPIPERLYRSMLASRDFMRAVNLMEQCALSHFDLEVHMNYAKYKGMNLDRIERDILRGYRMELTEHDDIPLRTSPHLFVDDYGAGYYAYLWGEMLMVDAFSRFKEKGILNPEIGAQFRRTVLSKGDSKPAAELYRNFMGRDPKPDAFIRRISAPAEPAPQP